MNSSAPFTDRPPVMARLPAAAQRSAAGPASLRPRPAARSELSPAQGRTMVGAIIALHVLLVWALLQVPAVRQAVVTTAPIFVDLIPPDAPPTPPPRPKAPVVPPRLAPLIVSKAAPAPASTFVVEPPPVEPPLPTPAVTVVEAVPAPPAPVAPTPPKVIPASGVQYLIPPPLEYPRASQRNRESGKVMVRVYIDEDGLPRNAQVTQSSGHPRLDEAAVTAVNKARFKPYTENGRPTAGWAFIPLTFDLEK